MKNWSMHRLEGRPGSGKPIERNTIFRLYSMTKPITAVAAMILMERGMLDLYEPVADILPAFAHQKVERDGKLYTPERPILMHDLFGDDFRAGISGGTDHGWTCSHKSV